MVGIKEAAHNLLLESKTKLAAQNTIQLIARDVNEYMKTKKMVVFFFDVKT